MRILVLNQYALPPGSPGITRHADLGKELVRRGHELTIIASGFDYLSRRAQRTGHHKRLVEEHDGITFVWLRTTAYEKNDNRRIRSMVEFAAKAGWEALRLSERPDVVVASSPNLLVGPAGVLSARRYRVPFVFEVRDFWPSSLVDLGAIKSGGPTHRLLEALEKRLYREAVAVICVPPYGHRRLEELGLDPRKAIHIPNAVPASALHDAPKTSSLPDSLRMILERERGRDIVLYAGAHGVANDLANVVDAADTLRESYPSRYRTTSFLFIGGGQQRDSLIEMARQRQHGNFYFHPPVSKDAAREAMLNASVLLVHVADAAVFKFGLSPNKLFDYLLAGQPVLMPAIGNMSLAEEMRAGLGFAPGDPADLARAIDQLLALPKADRGEMGRRGREAIAGRFNASATAAQLESLLLSVVGEDRRSRSV